LAISLRVRQKLSHTAQRDKHVHAENAEETMERNMGRKKLGWDGGWGRKVDIERVYPVCSVPASAEFSGSTAVN